MNQAAKVISSAVLGTDVEVIIVDSKRYVIQSPTIHRISGAISCLSSAGLSEGATVKEILLALEDVPGACAKALSVFIKGDENLAKELQRGTFEEIVDGLETAISMISAQVFFKAVSLAKNVASLAAKPKS